MRRERSAGSALFFVGNNNPKKGLSPLIFRFYSVICCRFQKRGCLVRTQWLRLYPMNLIRIMPAEGFFECLFLFFHQSVCVDAPFLLFMI